MIEGTINKEGEAALTRPPFTLKPRQVLALLKDAASDWIDDGAMRLSSSVAYYAIFSLAPLLVILISIAGFAFGEEAARGQLSQQIAIIAGQGAGDAIQAAVKSSAAQQSGGLLATILSTGLLLFGASTVFAELKDALNSIWGVIVKPGRPFFTLLRDRFFSFSIVLAIGFLLMVSLVVSAALAALGKWWGGWFAGWDVLLEILNFAVSLAIFTLLFAMIYKMMPRARIPWRDVWTFGHVPSREGSAGGAVPEGDGDAGSLAEKERKHHHQRSHHGDRGGDSRRQGSPGY